RLNRAGFADLPSTNRRPNASPALTGNSEAGRMAPLRDPWAPRRLLTDTRRFAGLTTDGPLSPLRCSCSEGLDAMNPLAQFTPTMADRKRRYLLHRFAAHVAVTIAIGFMSNYQAYCADSV